MRIVREITDGNQSLDLYSSVGHGTVTIRIVAGFTGADYTLGEPGSSKAPEFVNSLNELKTTLKMKGLPEHLIEETVERLKSHRLTEVTF